MNAMYPQPDGESEPENKEEKGAEKQILIPKSSFGGKVPAVGQTLTLKVVHDYEDEVAVEVEGEAEDKSELPGDEEFESAERETMDEGMHRM